MNQRYRRKLTRPAASVYKAINAFTLVEVVVALTVLSVSAVAVVGTLRMCSSASHHSRMLTKAVLLAESKLVEAKISDNTSFDTKHGQIESFKWQVQLVPTEIENLAAAKVTVMWQEQQRQQQYELFSLIGMKSFTGK